MKSSTLLLIATTSASRLGCLAFVMRPSKRSSSFHQPMLSIGSPILTAKQKQPSSMTVRSAMDGFELKDVFYDDTSMAFDAWEWTANIGAPAALVAGAVLVTLSETREDSAPRKNDTPFIRRAKLALRMLLLSSFALEVISIFVSTMTGSVLLGHGPAKKAVGYLSPLGLLIHHHEFEYLATQICFLQGLLNWLGAVAIDLWLPKQGETTSAKRMNKSLSWWLVSLIVWMMAFYNHHLTFYSDYGSMLKRFAVLFCKRYFAFRPLAIFYLPLSVFSTISTWKSFNSPPDDDED